MAKNLSASVALSIAANFNNPIDLRTTLDQLAYNWSKAFTDGGGDNQANILFADTRTLGGSSETLDLNGTTLQDAFGGNLALTKIKFIGIFAPEGNAGNISVGGAASNGVTSLFGDATDVDVVPPGGFMARGAPKAAGFAVVASTGDQLKIAGTTGDTYTIIIIGY